MLVNFEFSSHKARNDFIRTIHHMMHESVRRISVGGVKSQQTRLQTSAAHQRNHQRPCAVDTDSTAPSMSSIIAYTLQHQKALL